MNSQIERDSVINPYRKIIYEYSGRIFTFDDKVPLSESELELQSIEPFLLSLEMKSRSKFEEQFIKSHSKLKNKENVIVELGSGSGGHLIKLAQKFPDFLLYGFEFRYKRCVRTIQKAGDLDNIFVLQTTANNFNQLFLPNSIDRLYVNFPDPWQKKRWLKNRLLNATFIDNLLLSLKSGGIFSFKTDHDEYFGSFLEILKSSEALKQNKLKIVIETTDLYQSWCHNSDIYNNIIDEGRIITEFESMFLREKKNINYLRCVVG